MRRADIAMPFREIARAKVNLTLSVLGRRSDGYHDIESLVTFADIGDQVTFLPGPDCRVRTSGPFAADIEGPNLLEKTVSLLRDLDPEFLLGAFELEKNLPVAAGLGGGSADAAALLRAVRTANPERAGRIDWHALAARLGADVPVCLASAPGLIRGVGDRIELLNSAHPRPPLAAVLVNPRIPLPTAHIYGALASFSPSPRTSRGEGTGATTFLDSEALVAYMRARGNDLEPPAISLRPVIADIKAALGAQPGCWLAAMSGSGPTCFGIFGDDASAARGADALAGAHPGWWVIPTRLDNPAQAQLNSPG
jgi:4-diphosphocytidyl-2-C-methyl-D-erythritol kinase